MLFYSDTKAQVANILMTVANCIVTIITAVNFLKTGNCELNLQPSITRAPLVLGVLSFMCICLSKWTFFVGANIMISLLNVVYIGGFGVFALTVTQKSGGEALPGVAYKEYNLTDYSGWLQNRVENAERWSKIDDCLHRHHACKRMTHGNWANITLQQFHTKRLSSIESGCCKPSNNCNFTYVSPTNWSKIANSTDTNPDCRAWDNNPKVLCFDCQSCKAGVVDKYWKKLHGYPLS